MYESAECQAVPPGRREVGDVDSSVALSLLLTPGQQPVRTHLGPCGRGTAYQLYGHQGDTVIKKIIVLLLGQH